MTTATAATAAAAAAAGTTTTTTTPMAAVAGPAPAAAEAAAAVLSAEAQALGPETRGMKLEAFGERLHSIVAFASLELAREGRRRGDDKGDAAAKDADADANDDDDDAGDDNDEDGSGPRLASLAREWLLLITAVSIHAPELIELTERYDLQRRRAVDPPAPGDARAEAAERKLFERRSAKALNAARLSPSQRQAVADAYAYFQNETRRPIDDWKQAAQELAASADAAAASAAPATAAGCAAASVDALSRAVARLLVARSAFCAAVFSTLTPRQLMRAIVATYPACLRPVMLGAAALRAEEQEGGRAAAAAATSS
jgi:hypothetical protein